MLDAISPKTVIKSAGNMASAIRSSPAYWYILTDKVSKSKGLRINVIGNSLIVSTNTRSDPTKIGPFRSGKCILLIIPSQLEPSPYAASSRLGDILSNPESSVPFEIVKKRTMYPQIRSNIAMK